MQMTQMEQRAAQSWCPVYERPMGNALNCQDDLRFISLRPGQEQHCKLRCTFTVDRLQTARSQPCVAQIDMWHNALLYCGCARTMLKECTAQGATNSNCGDLSWLCQRQNGPYNNHELPPMGYISQGQAQAAGAMKPASTDIRARSECMSIMYVYNRRKWSRRKVQSTIMRQYRQGHFDRC